MRLSGPAFDRLVSDHGERPGVIEYLQVLKLAAEETVERVEPLLRVQLARAGKWRATEVRRPGGAAGEESHRTGRPDPESEGL